MNLDRDQIKLQQISMTRIVDTCEVEIKLLSQR